MHAAFRELHERSEALITQLWNGLREIRHVRVYGPPSRTPRTPTIAFTVDDVPAIEVAEKLVERGVFLSHGDFYAMTVVERLGQMPHGLVRAGHHIGRSRSITGWRARYRASVMNHSEAGDSDF